MEPPKSDVGVLSAIVGVLSFLGGIMVGVVRVSWSLSKFNTRVEGVEEEVKDLKTIIFQERGGLNLLSVEAHKEICISNQEKFGMIMDSLKENLDTLSDKIKEIKTNGTEIQELNLVLKRIEIFLADHRKK